MKDLFKYIDEYGACDFSRIPFGEIDALLLCQLSYPKLGEIMTGDTVLTLQEIREHPESDKLYTDRFFGSMYRQIVDAAAGTVRFGRIRAGRFCEEVCEEQTMQFAAVTFDLGDGNAFIAYRGTDEKVTGWREDLNRGITAVMPSQERALRYLCEIAGAHPEAQLIIGGHSKGGTQAVYAAAMADDTIKSRIRAVYSFDGIGLGDEFYASAAYRGIARLVSKMVPDRSIIGMLFERRGNCTVVRSRGSCLKQHDFMNWRIDGRRLVRSMDLRPGARRRARRLNLWIRSMGQSERRFLVGLADDLLQACDLTNIYDIFLHIPARIRAIVRRLKQYEKEERRELRELLRRYRRAV